jgi:hypothetical protein
VLAMGYVSIRGIDPGTFRCSDISRTFFPWFRKIPLATSFGVPMVSAYCVVGGRSVAHYLFVGETLSLESLVECVVTTISFDTFMVGGRLRWRMLRVPCAVNVRTTVFANAVGILAKDYCLASSDLKMDQK